jgi:hypothetical protein
MAARAWIQQCHWATFYQNMKTNGIGDDSADAAGGKTRETLL